MLPELILKEERADNFSFLLFLGFASAVIGIYGARILFPSEADLISVFFAAIPLMFPLTQKFLKDEAGGRPHFEEVEIYGSLFIGQVFAFYLATLMLPEFFEIQIGVFEAQLSQMGITGYAMLGSDFLSILVNNMVVFGFIIATASLIGSAGAFILTWNGSVLGVFLGILTRQLSGLSVIIGSEDVPSPLAYVPHATLEMGGFIVAGIAGSLISAAVYRKHFDRETWSDLIKLVMAGIALIFLGAFVETA